MKSRRSSNATWVADRSLHGGADELDLGGGPGRLFLAGKHFVGPDPAGALHALGANRIVCLCELVEVEARYPSYAAWLLDGRALLRAIPDLHAPEPAAARALVAELEELLGESEGVILHCGAGHGRAGTMAAALLVCRGASPAEALERVASARPMAGPQREVQRSLLDDLAVPESGELSPPR